MANIYYEADADRSFIADARLRCWAMGRKATPMP